MQDWHAKLFESERFVTYRSFKSTFQTEKYLTSITVSKFRYSLTRLRLGSCDLNINNWYNEKSKNCPFCEKVENESHFLFECSKYSCLRQKYIQRHCSYLDTNCLVYMLQSESELIVRNLAMCIFMLLKLGVKIKYVYVCFFSSLYKYIHLDVVDYSCPTVTGLSMDCLHLKFYHLT